MHRGRIILAALALSSCRYMPPVVHHLATADSSTSSFTVNVDCTSMDVTVSGYPVGTVFYVGMGSDPPYGFTIGTPDPWGRAIETNGTVVGHFDVNDYNATHEFEATLDAGTTRLFDHTVSCG